MGLDRACDAGSVNGLRLTCDVTNPADVAAAYATTIDQFGTVDVLVNNAAMRQRDLFPPHGAGAVLDADGEQRLEWAAPGLSESTVRRVEGRAHQPEFLSCRGAQNTHCGRQRRLSSRYPHDGRAAVGIRVGSLLKPEHVVPLVVHLASQDASGDTGRAFDAVQWNVRHGFGGAEQWLAQPANNPGR